MTYENKNYLHLNKENKQSDYSFSDLISIAHNYGMELSAYRYSKEEEVSIKTPFLALIDQNHLVLISSYNSFACTIYDPQCGKVKIRTSDFKNRWSGDTLEIESYSPQEYKNNPRFLYSKHYKLNSSLLTVTSLASLLIGFFFVRNEMYVFIPIILLVVSIISELVGKWYLIKEIYFFDKQFIKLFFKNSKNKKEDLLKYSEFKKMHFSFINNGLMALLISAAIIVCLILNNAMNAIAVLFLLFINVCDRLIFRKNDNVKLAELNRQENEAVNDESSSSIEKIELVSQKANNYALRFSLRNYVYMFLVLMLSFLMMIASNVVSVNFIIFHFGMFYYLNTNFDVLLNYSDKRKEYEQAKARFIDKCNL